jgi:(p)ppGpp synthase/HD superfamily hydrolase
MNAIGQTRKTDLVPLAAAFAGMCHARQLRKYTGGLYIYHPAEVAEIVRSVPHDEAMLAAAWLHDVVEDCGITLPEIRLRFGMDVAKLVDELTNPPNIEGENRASRKARVLVRYTTASARACTIKLADIISNAPSIRHYDPKFWEVWGNEARHLYVVMSDRADPVLLAKARELLDDGSGFPVIR